MSLFSKKRNYGNTNDTGKVPDRGFIDRVKYDGPRDVLAWKFPYDNLSTGTVLIVNHSQSAILVKNGTICDFFDEGRHILKTGNIPILQRITNLSFGNNTPFTAEVWFFNHTVKRSLKWGTREPIYIEDKKYGVVVPVRSYGEFGIRIGDVEVYLSELIGALHIETVEDIRKHFMSAIITSLKNIIATELASKSEITSVFDIQTKLSELSSNAKAMLSSKFSAYGITLTNFYVESVNFDEEDETVKEVRRAMSRAAKRRIEGTDYQEERKLDILQAAAGNEGQGGNIMGAGIGLAMGAGIGKELGEALGGVLNTKKRTTKKRTTKKRTTKKDSNDE